MELFLLAAFFLGIPLLAAEESSPLESPEEDDSESAAVSVQELVGTDSADTLVGEDTNDTLIGGSGDDRLFGDEPRIGTGSSQNGNDSLVGGEGNDTLAGNGGEDTLLGGAGDDSIFDYEIWDYEASDNMSPNASLVDGGAGNDSIHVDAGSTITGGEGEDVINIYQTQDSSEVTEITDFDPDQDSLRIVLAVESETTDQISVADSEDGAGSAVFFGDTLIATLSGTPGLEISDLDIVVELAYPVSDYQDGSSNSTILGNSSDNVIHGGEGDDAIILSEGEPLYYGHAGDGEDQAFGGAGNDTLVGNGAWFNESGLDGNYEEWQPAEMSIATDTLNGGSGDDMLWSYNGAELTGGEGDDVFGIIHETPEHTEGLVLPPTVITDFNPAEDWIAVQMGPIYGHPTYDEVSVEVWEDGTGADVLLDGAVVAQVHGGQTLTTDQIQQVQWIGDLVSTPTV